MSSSRGSCPLGALGDGPDAALAAPGRHAAQHGDTRCSSRAIVKCVLGHVPGARTLTDAFSESLLSIHSQSILSPFSAYILSIHSQSIGSPFSAYILSPFAVHSQSIRSPFSVHSQSITSITSHSVQLASDTLTLVRLMSAHNSVSFLLPANETASFARLLRTLDGSSTELGVAGYGLSCATLEEVFLRIARYDWSVVRIYPRFLRTIGPS
eukprot:433546-Prorocentrum_minimum.AAC.1